MLGYKLETMPQSLTKYKANENQIYFTKQINISNVCMM